MLSANVIETDALYLTNLVKNGSSISSSYRTYGTPFYYTNWLIPEHTYYYSFKYKYTDPANSSLAPNYVLLFYADGYAPANGGTWLPVNGTSELSFSGLFTPTTMWSNDALGSWAYGSVYHKYQSENTTVTTSVAKMQLREVVVTDVTFLYQLFKGQGLTDAQCLTKINAYGTLNMFYDSEGAHEEVSYPLAEILQKLSIKKSYAYGNLFIECDGMVAYSCNKNNSTDCYFDKSDWLWAYNNGGGSVTRKRVVDTSSPFYPKHSYVLLVKSAVTNTSPSPGLGGIYNSVQPAKGDLIVEKLVAKVPVGYSILCYNNSVAGGEIAPTIYNGTGNYEEYTFTYKIGSSGTPGTIGHIAVHANSDAPDANSVTWYLAYINYCKLTGTGITDWSALPGKVKVKSDKLYISEIDSQNLFLNGDGSDTNMPLPSKYLWIDGRNYDLAGWNAIMQPPTTTTGFDDSLYGKIQLVGPRMPINPLSRYKFSCRIWADGSKLSSFYLALPYYTSDNDSALLKAPDVWYRSGTRTLLKANAAVGATTLTVNSTANWVAGIANSGVGFKSSVYRSYHDLGYQTFNSGIKSVGSNTITLYSGLTKAHYANEYVLQALDGHQFYYPITKTQLPIKEWKEFEIYFGKPDLMWDGRGTSWVDIPWDARYIGFAPNIYSNNSESPIIYDNIRIEEVYTPAEKKDLKVQIKHYVPRKGNVYDPDTDNLLAIQHAGTNGNYTANNDKIYVDGTELTPRATDGYRSIRLKPGEHSITYMPVAYDVNSKHYLNTLTKWISNDVTVVNDKFIMPYHNARLTWEFDTSLVYKVSIGSNTDSNLKIGTDGYNYDTTDIYVHKGDIVYWELNPTYIVGEYEVQFSSSKVLDLYTDSGLFLMPNEDVVINGASYNDGDSCCVRLSKNVSPAKANSTSNYYNNTDITTTCLYFLVRDHVKISLSDGTVSTGPGRRELTKWNFLSSNDVTLTYKNFLYSFIVPRHDVTLIPDVSTIKEYKVTVGLCSGCVITVGTANMSLATNTSCWVQVESVCFVNVSFTGNNNVCDIILEDENGTLLDSYQNQSGGITFAMKDTYGPITIKGTAKQDTYICPFDGLVIYSITRSQGSRGLSNRNVSIVQEIFNGFHDELNALDDVTNDGKWSNLPNYDYSSPAYIMSSRNFTVFCAFSGPEGFSGMLEVIPCILNDGDSIPTAITEECVLIEYNSNRTTISGNSQNGRIWYSFNRIECSNNKSVYIGSVSYYEGEQLQQCSNLFFKFTGSDLEDNYNINFAYINDQNSPAMYPGYTPIIESNNYMSPVIKVEDYYQLEPSCYDMQFIKANFANTTDFLIQIGLLNWDEVYVSLAYASELDEGVILGNKTLSSVLKMSLMDINTANNSYNTDFGYQNNVLSFTVNNLCEQQIISDDEFRNIINEDGTLIVTVGWRRTIYTFFVGKCPVVNITYKEEIRDTTWDNSMWDGGSIVINYGNDLIDGKNLNNVNNG